MKKVALLLGISLIILFSLLHLDNAEALVYNNEEFGVSLTLPEDWKVFDVREMVVMDKTVHGGDIHVIFTSPDEKMGLMLVNHDGRYGLDGHFDHFQYYHTYDDKILEHDKNKFQKTYGREIVNINGYRAIKAKAIDEGGADVFTYTLASDKTGFQLTTIGSSDFQKILDSINIKNGVKFETDKRGIIYSDLPYEGLTISTIILQIQPIDIQYNNRNEIVYVSSEHTNNVILVDKNSNSIIGTIPVEKPDKITVNSKSNEVYVVSRNTPIVNVIDGYNNSLTKIVLVNLFPYSLSINDDTNTVYISSKVNNTIAVLDGTSKELINTISVGKSPTDVKVNVKSNLLYVINSGASSVSVIDTLSNSLKTEIKLSSNPAGIEVDGKRNIFYVMHENSKTLTKIDGLSNKIIDKIEFEDSVNAVLFDSKNDKLIVGIPKKFLIIDPATNKISQEIRVENFNVVTVTENLDYAFYGTIMESGLYSLDIEKETSKRIDFGYSPGKLAVNPETNLLYIANSKPNSIIVVDGLNKSVVDLVELRFEPTGLAVNPETNKIYAIHYGQHRMSVIDGNANKVIKEISVGKPQMSLYDFNREEFLENQLFSSNPRVVMVNTLTNKIYVGDSNHSWEVKKSTKEILRHDFQSLLYVIDGYYDEVVDKILIDEYINGISIDKLSNTIFVSSYSYYHHLITMISGDDNEIIAEVDVENLYEVDVNPKLGTLYGVGRPDVLPAFYVADLESKELTHKLAITPSGILEPVFEADLHRDVVYLGVNNYFYVLNGRTGEVIEKIKVDPIVDMTLNSQSGTIYLSRTSGTITVFEQGENNNLEVIPELIKAPTEKIPEWIKTNAKWFSKGSIGDSDFTRGIEYMIKEGIMKIPNLPEQASETAESKVPDWIKSNAGWWADGLISDSDFVKGIQYLVENGIIKP